MRSHARWTLTGSFVLHAVVVLAILIAPVLGQSALPPLTRPLVILFAESVPVPKAPVVTRLPERATTTPPTIPDHAPSGFRDETPAVTPGPARAGIPGGLDLPVDRGPSILSAGRSETLQTVAPPTPIRPIRPGGNILPPARTGYVAPVYPAIAIQARSEGTVILEAVIDETGAVRDVTVLRSVPLLDRAAIDAVRQWRYSPTRLNGVPVAIVMTVSVTFTLK
jgi:protein TonB